LNAGQTTKRLKHKLVNRNRNERRKLKNIKSVPTRIYDEEKVTPILMNKFEETLEMEEILLSSRFSIDKFGLNLQGFKTLQV
jgi:hypothetical protein